VIKTGCWVPGNNGTKWRDRILIYTISLTKESTSTYPFHVSEPISVEICRLREKKKKKE
jgi:hypothetical protein